MVSKSFCLDDVGKDTKNLPITLESQPLTPGVYRCSPKRQEKEFLQLYIKARARDSETKAKQRSRPHFSSYPSKPSGFQDENDGGEEIPSPNRSDSSFRKKGVLKSIDINTISKTFTPDKPSQFKINRESGASYKGEVEEAKISNFKPRHDSHNESLHDIDVKEVNNLSQCPASMDILLPALKETQLKSSEDLEAQNDHGHENATEPEQQQQRREYEEVNQHQIQLEYENENPSQRQTQDRNQNQNQSENLTQAIGARNAPNRSRPNRITFGRNVEVTYRRIFKIYLVWFLSYGVLLGFNFGILPYFIVLFFAILFESYFIYEVCQKDPRQESDPIEEKKKLNLSIQMISIIVLEILGTIKLAGVDFPLSLTAIPIFITTIITCYLHNTSGERTSSSALGTIFQTLLSLQILSICLKVDGVLKWSWQGVFWVSWAFLVAVVFYCFGLFIIFLFFLCFEESNTTRGYKRAGLTWVLSAMCGYVAVLFYLLFGFTGKLETGDDHNRISHALFGGLIHIVFLAAFTAVAKTKIKKFLRSIVRADAEREQKKEPAVRFEKANEGLPSYIVRFTPSYFLTFDDSLKVKDGLKLRNIKKKVSMMKSYQYRRAGPGLRENGSNSKANKSPLLPFSLFGRKTGQGNSGLDKRDSDPLVKKISSPEMAEEASPESLQARIEKRKSSQIKQILPLRVNVSEVRTPLDVKPKPKNYGSEVRGKFGNAQEEVSHLEDKNEKLCFSANDVELAKKMEVYDFLSEVRTPMALSKKVASEKDEEKACIICYDKYPDAVVMGCGHGGICYGCALESWKKSRECFMCRGRIDKVLHIDTNKLGKFNMRRVLSATKLVREREDFRDRETYRDRENFADAMYIARNHI